MRVRAFERNAADCSLPGWRIRRMLLAVGVAVALSGCAFIQGLFPGIVTSQATEGEAGSDSGIETTISDSQVTAQTDDVKRYRPGAARKIYQRWSNRIYKGKLPPLVYAVAVVETHVDARGNVRAVTFSRKPTQAPEVSREIVELVKAASPLPNPGALGAHTYIDTWLWDRSGKFQLDTLTEGQRSR